MVSPPPSDTGNPLGRARFLIWNLQGSGHYFSLSPAPLVFFQRVGVYTVEDVGANLFSSRFPNPSRRENRERFFRRINPPERETRNALWPISDRRRLPYPGLLTWASSHFLIGVGPSLSISIRVRVLLTDHRSRRSTLLPAGNPMRSTRTAQPFFTLFDLGSGIGLGLQSPGSPQELSSYSIKLALRRGPLSFAHYSSPSGRLACRSEYVTGCASCRPILSF